jgi:prepilin-type N-terminal cleavage/methylation domain-containing protein
VALVTLAFTNSLEHLPRLHWFLSTEKCGFTSDRLGHVRTIMGDPRHRERAGEGFTLVEVLVALAMAAIGFGVILHSVGLQMSMVANSLNRHQMLLYASQVLETHLANGLVEEQVTEAEVSSSQEEEGEEGDPSQLLPRFIYGLDTQPVTADPRVQQVTASVKGPIRGGVRLSAYRLRVKRD